MLLTGASWDAEKSRKPKALYDQQQGKTKWEKQPSDKAEVDHPSPAWDDSRSGTGRGDQA